MLAVTPEHHTLFQEAGAMMSSALAGGAVWRYGAIFLKDLPRPRSNERWYAVIFNIAQDLANNPEAKVHINGTVTSGGVGGKDGGPAQ